MARSFLTTPIVDPVKAPFSKRSFTHLNTALDELGEDIVKGILSGNYTTNDLVILYGCVVTANIPGTSSVTAGAIYYNGRIYKVDANASISSPANTLVWSIATTYISGDPATFSDGSSSNFHKIEKFQLTNAGTGTGLADYNAATVKNIYSISTGAITFSTGWSDNGTSFKLMPLGEVEVQFSVTISAGGTTTVGTIPAAYAPASIKRFTVADYNGTDGASELCNIQINGTNVLMLKQSDGTKPANRGGFLCTLKYNIYN